MRNALEKTSIPAVLEFVPGGFEGVRIKAKIAVPHPVRLQSPHFISYCFQMPLLSDNIFERR